MDFYLAGGLYMTGGIYFYPVFGRPFKDDIVTVQVKHAYTNPIKNFILRLKGYIFATETF